MQIKSIILSLLIFAALPCFAGVYADLEFGDSRETVQRKLKSSDMVEQTMPDTYISRTGLNGIFKCKAQLAGLTYHLYFDWNDDGNLDEITLRSNKLEQADYRTSLYQAWKEAGKLFTQVYKAPAQNAGFPNKDALGDSSIMMSHIWHKGPNESILMGTGMNQTNCFLAIRFVNRHVKPARTVTRKFGPRR
jgi:hypothetical protein